MTSSAPRPLRVLVIEHDPADAELMVHELEKGGLQARADVVATPAAFAARLDAETYDLILSDFRLPDWTAIEALDLLHHRKLETPLIIVSGTIGEQRAIDCVKAGAADYVTKDRLVRLPFVVRRALEERTLRATQRATEERYRVLFDSSPLPTWVLDLATHRILAVNQSAVLHYGYSRDEFLTLCIEDLRPPEDASGLNEHLGHHRKKDGTPMTVELSVHTLTWEGRDAELIVAHDVTERKQGEEALRRSEAQLRLLLESTAEGIYGIDTTGRCTFCNPAAARLLGYHRTEDIQGKETHTLMHHSYPDGSPYPSEDCPISQSFRRGEGRHSDHEVFWRADGTSLPVEYWSHPIQSGGRVVGAVVTFLDITQRRGAQDALADSEARLRKIIEASFDGIAITVDGRLLEANRGLAAMFGYPMEEVIGRRITDFVAEESRADVARRVAEGFEGTYEEVGLRKDGRKVFLEATAKTHSINGRPGRITALRDVTEKRQLEGQFRQAQKMEAVGRLAGGIAHDFNNLLTVISSYSELLLEDLVIGDQRRGDVEEIRKAAGTAAALTRQLLAFSRQQVLEPRVLNVNAVVESAHKMLKRLIGEDVELVATLAADLGSVKADPSQIEQVIMNLAINSRDAMPQGGKLTIETANVEVDETYARGRPDTRPGSYVLLAVSDTGIGMSEEIRGHVFEPFFTTKENGTGLGLATVYGIVKQSGGFIWVYSEPGQGTTFKTYLPRVDLPADVTLSLVGATPGGAETVLLVEDGAAVRAVTRQVLERQGYTILEAPDADTALRLAAAHKGPIHLLLTDVVMPKMSGRELADQLTALRANLKVLFVSGYTDDAVVRHGVLTAGIAFLQKPFTPDGLARKIRAVLDG